jgi:hypothetical protein
MNLKDRGGTRDRIPLKKKTASISSANETPVQQHRESTLVQKGNPFSSLRAAVKTQSEAQQKE